MADLPTNLRAFLLDATAITDIVGDTGVYQGMVPQDVALPYVWFRRASRRLEPTLDAEPGDDPDELWFDVEAISDDLDVAQSLADAITDALGNYRGTFGDALIQGAFVDDQDDDYVPRGTVGETELHVAALAVQIFP